MASGATTVIIFKQPIFRFWWQVAGEIYVLTFIMRLSARLDKIKKHTWVFRKISAQLRESNSSLLSVITETITGIKTIKSFCAFSSRQEKFTSKAKTCYENAHSALKLSMFSSIARTVIDTVVWLSVMGYGGFLVLKGIITLGSLIAAYTLITRIFGPVQQIANTYLTIVASLVSLNRLSYLIQLQPTFDDGAKRKLEKIGDIQITDLTFGYDDKEKVLKGVNLIIPEGRMIGIVGESGVGKSTLLNLICRFYEPDEGTITAGNIDIREISIDCWRKQIALVDQDSFLFNCSIKENLLYGNPNAKMDEIIAVCEQSYIHHIIESFPDKYETIVGERGLALSNGEKQRLCIARALLKYPKILILDEATGFVDSESERQIRKSLTDLRKKGMTIIVVAHRLSMVREVDEIVLLQHGKIVERGTHNELLAAQGLYKRFYDASNRITDTLLD
ncbi:MAG: ABC transporter ATP-binding protein [Deltaproteobacteria bacterium]|nr:ABC transporter ATP-binding protein [Deltaproteobacteria bacterium]